MGGSDQWGNIVTGTELIRRKSGSEVYALTTPLIKKADGGKFGKTEAGNVWLSKERTSPYQFYQYWLNTSDEDAATYLKIFTLLSRETIESLRAQHDEAPHHRLMQRTLAADVTQRVHGIEELNKALAASEILFGKATSEALNALDEATFFQVFDGVPQAQISKERLEQGIPIIDLLVSESQFLSSNSEARRELKANSMAVNKERIDEQFILNSQHLLNNRYVLISKGKKSNFIVVFH